MPDISAGLYRAARAVRRLRFGAGVGSWSRSRQLLEMVRYVLRGSFTPLEYHQYGFHLRTRVRSGYVPLRWIESEFRQTLNPAASTAVLKDKLEFSRFYAARGLPVASVFGFFHPEAGRGDVPRPVRDAVELARVLAERAPGRFVAKPVGSIGGKGMMLLEITRDGRLVDGRTGVSVQTGELARWMESDIAVRQPREDSGTGYLLQEYVRGHPLMNPFAGAALNTVRIATLRGRDGTIRLDFAMLRVARPGAVTDNLHQGGLVASVDVRNGRIAGATFGYENRAGPWIERRPENLSTRFPAGFVPEWAGLAATARRFHEATPGLQSVGWDVALTPDGPVVLEGNDNWDMVIAQVLDGPYLSPGRRSVLRDYGLTLP